MRRNAVRCLVAAGVVLVAASTIVRAQVRDTMALVVPANAMSFIAMGDWGRQGEYNQRDVAKQMGIAAQKLDAEFVLALGDNFYPNGVQSAQDPQWTQSFESIYTAHALNVDWYVALGNHDYHGNPQAEVDYSKVSRRWRMPKRYFSVKQAVAPGVTAEFLVIDTSPFIAAYRKEPDKYFLAGTDTAAQRRWIDSTLRVSTAKWKFIVGHHNVYSGGGRTVMPDMERLLVPLMTRYGVTAYICGHEHHLEHIVPEGTKLNFLISGAGSETRPSAPTKGTKFVSSSAGFMALSMTADSVVVQAIDMSGKMLYRSSLKP